MHCQPLYRHLVDICSKFNQACLLCDEPADNGYPLCTACELELPWFSHRCTTCSLPMPNDGLTCVECSLRPPAFSQVETPWLYGFPIDALIRGFKHHGRWPWGRLMGELLGHWLSARFEQGLPRPHCLLPVPLARRRLRERGFNQAQMLASRLSRQLGIRCDAHSLVRTRETASQQGLDAQKRRSNLRDAFALAPRSRLAGLHVALVDDVFTTGATARIIASLLKREGVVRVDVYCLARTPSPSDA